MNVFRTKQTFHIVLKEPKRNDREASKILTIQPCIKMPIYMFSNRFKFSCVAPCMVKLCETLIKLRNELSNVNKINFYSIFQLITVCAKTINNNNFHSPLVFFGRQLFTRVYKQYEARHLALCRYNFFRRFTHSRNEAWALSIDMTHNSLMKNCLLDIHKH